METAMDCMCWMKGDCMTGTDWRSRWGLLEVSLHSWWLGLVALDLVRTIQSFVEERWIAKHKIFPIDGANWWWWKISRPNAPGFNGMIIAWKAWKKNTQSKGDQGGLAKNPSMLKLVFLLNFRVPTFQELCKTFLHLSWMRVYIVCFWSGYLFCNFPYICGGQRVQG